MCQIFDKVKYLCSEKPLKMSYPQRIDNLNDSAG